MNPRTRRAALYAIGAIALLASIDALVHSYTGLYSWAVQHRLGGWQGWSWPAEIDVFLVAGELALYVAYLDSWPGRQKMWPWAAAVTGLLVSVAGNVGHVQPLRGLPVTAADRITAATSPLAAFAGLMIGLLVLKMSNRHLAAEGRESDAGGDQAAVQRLAVTGSPGEALDDAFAGQPGLLVSQRSLLLQDAAEIMEAGRVSGQVVSRRALAAQLRGRGHRFSNAQLGQIADAAPAAGERVA